MTKTFTAQLKAAIRKSKEDLRYVMTESIQDVLEGAQTPQVGISKGATSFVEGKIPVAESDLINSLEVEGNVGQTSYIVAIAGMNPGDSMEFTWTEAHAARMELGFFGTDELGRTYNQAGRHFIGRNAEKFPQFVEVHAKEVHP